MLSGKCEAQAEPASPPQQTQQQQNTTQTPPIINQAPLEAKGYQASCDKPKDREEADLCEQRRMAKAAEDAVWWARFQTFVGSLGFGAVVASLFLAGWAAWAASQSAKAAKSSAEFASKTVKIMEDTAERQLRAYIVVDYKDLHDQKSADDRFVFHLEIRNSGQTPAYELRTNSRVCVLPHPITTDFDFVVAPQANESVVMLGPQQKRELESTAEKSFSREEMIRVADSASGWRVYTFGTVRYEDCFRKQPRFTNFCHFADWIPLGPPGLFRISVRASEHHNDAN